MSNPLLAFWHLVFAHRRDDDRLRRLRATIPTTASSDASATIFLVLRRMRAPLIVLIVIFAVSVLGLSLIPGREPDGDPWRMTFFDAFYFMSYTATTIGFGEIPQTFTYTQRMWVTFSIYLTVIGWAYAIGSVLSLLQDRSFRDALGLRRFTRRVAHLREPFLLIVGYGQTGALLGRALDDRNRRFVVIDSSEDRIEDLELDDYHADVPGLVADARDPSHLAAAGLAHSYCEGVVVVTNDDEVNLAVTMAAALLRPDLPIIARTASRSIARQMQEFGNPVIVNPFDRFGDRLAVALRAPSTFRLVSWLTSTEDAGPPAPRPGPPRGRWFVCGYGQFGQEISRDLRAEGFEVTVVEMGEGAAPPPPGEPSPDEDEALVAAGLESAVGLVAATENDTVNLSVVASARRIKSSLYLVARQNLPSTSSLYDAMNLDALLVPGDIVAREALARLAHPLLWDFLVDVPSTDDAWAARLLERLLDLCGERSPHLWDVQITAEEAPAVLARGHDVRLADVLRDPGGREHHLHAVPLLLVRGGRRHLWPEEDDVTLEEGDELLFAGRPASRHILESTLQTEADLEYVVTGRRIASGWVWRKVTERVRPPA